MSAVVFLLLALAIIVVGSVAVYLRQRTPSSLDAGIEGFRREMNALAVRHGNRTNGHGHGHGNGANGSGGASGASGMSGASTTTGAAETVGPPGPPGPVEGEG